MTNDEVRTTPSRMTQPGEMDCFYFTTLPNGWTVGRFAALDALDGVIHAVTTRDGLDPHLVAQDPAAAGPPDRKTPWAFQRSPGPTRRTPGRCCRWTGAA